MESLNKNFEKCRYCNLDFVPHHGSSKYCCDEHRKLAKKQMSKDRFKDYKFYRDKYKSKKIVDETINPIPPTLTPTIMGWQCPLCGTIYSPYQTQCFNFHSSTITSSSTTQIK